MNLPILSTGLGFDLLQDVRVLDLTNSVAGPFSTMLLGDLGASVIKIERPGVGDPTRSWGPPFLDGESLWFLSINRNKQSITLDYSSDRGSEILRRLVNESDIVVLNQPPGLAKQRGIDPKSLWAVREDLIYIAITGFGLTGERADWTCYDLIAEGYSGVMDLTGEADGSPQKIGAPAADMIAGQDAALAAVAALYSRQRTNKGRLIDVSLVNSMTRFLSCRIVPFMGSGDLPRRSGGTDSVIAIYQTFNTLDEPLTLALGSDSIWRRFWEAVGDNSMARAAAYPTNERRRAARETIVAKIQELLLTRRRDDWLDTFAQARVPAGPIYRLDEVVEDAELRRQRLIYGLDTGGQIVPQVGTGIAVDGTHNTPRLAPPRLGQHTDAVLTDLLRFSPDEIEELRRQRIV
jgi:crotonobetainyl-CoA:carnitine CoA-transferase CaiB-like acyl-CoA transferase